MLLLERYLPYAFLDNIRTFNSDDNCRLETPPGGGTPGGRRRSLPRIPIYEPATPDSAASRPRAGQENDMSPWSPMHSPSWVHPHPKFIYDQQPPPPHPVMMDQFDEYLYKSKHIGSW